METIRAIITRRTVKEFDTSRPLPVEAVQGLVNIALHAPNHRMNQPWRFRLIGPEALNRLKEAAGGGAAKLERAPTLVVVSCECSDNPVHSQEDLLATGCAAYIMLLAAHDQGYVGYWRTPALLRDDAGRAALGIPDGETVVGLIHLGYAADSEVESSAPPRDANGVFTALD